MQLSEAIEMVKAAGYTVRKQVISRKKALSKVGPTFVALWADNTKTRMSIHCSDQALDLPRAVRVSWAAYRSRTNYQGLALNIRAGWFERDGDPIQDYTDISVLDYVKALT